MDSVGSVACKRCRPNSVRPCDKYEKRHKRPHVSMSAPGPASITSYQSPQQSQSDLHPSLPPSLWTKVRKQSVALHVVDWTSNILNVLHFQHPIDHRCLGRLHQNNWSRSL